MKAKTGFNNAATLGFLVAAVLAAGCAQENQEKTVTAADGGKVTVIDADCTVIDRNPSLHFNGANYPNERPYYTYNFKTGILDFNASSWGGGYGAVWKTQIPIDDIPNVNRNQERALEMFKYLSTPAQCKAPTFKK